MTVSDSSTVTNWSILGEFSVSAAAFFRLQTGSLSFLESKNPTPRYASGMKRFNIHISTVHYWVIDSEWVRFKVTRATGFMFVPAEQLDFAYDRSWHKAANI